ncbi:MAG TPA: tetratricopeptide repeat protein [Gemmatimonadaceae bacterium]|nr:tetratricopeptide repeat protein [Gemmatimonadaceae bacterium]
MSARSTRRIAALASLVFAPLTATSQADPAFKASTTNATAANEFRIGVRDMQNLSLDAALQHFQTAINADPNFGLARVLYASFGPLTPQQVETEANRAVADAARANTNELVLAAAYREAALGHNTAAAALFTAAAKMIPNDPLVAWQAAGGFGAPITATREFVASHPDYPLGYNTLAYQAWFDGDRAASLAAAKKQIEILADAPNPYDTYAELLQWSGDFAGAATQYRKAAATAPRFPEAYAGLAEVAALQGQYDQARTYLNQAIANSWTPRQKLGYMRQIVGTYALQGTSAADITRALEAAIAESKAQNVPKQTALLYSELATVQANAGNVNAAHQSIAMARAADKDVSWNVHYFGGMAHGLMKHWAPFGEELSAMKAQAAADPTVPAVFVKALEGYQLTQQGKPADALTVLMSADTTNVLIMSRIAEAHAAMGHADVAAAWNDRINKDYSLALGDFTNVNSRRRAARK